MGVTQRETRAVTVEQQFIDEATALLAPKPTTSLRSRLRARRDRSQSDDGFALVLAYVFQTAHHHPNNKRLQVAADRLRRNPRGDHGSYVSSILFNAFEKTQRGTEMYDRVRATIPIITEQKRKTIQTREFNSTNMPKGVMNGRGSDNGSNCFDE